MKDASDKWGDFLLVKEELGFKRVLESHGRHFAFSPKKVGCLHLKNVEPIIMVIFTTPHVPWNIKTITMPSAHIPKLIELLKKKINMAILVLLTMIDG